MLGTVYKVDLLTESRSKIRDLVQQTMLRTNRRTHYGGGATVSGGSSGPSAVAATAATSAPADAKAVIDVADTTSNDDASSSSSSSRASSRSKRGRKTRRGGKKGKKEKAEKKDKKNKKQKGGKRQRSSSSSSKAKEGKKHKKEKKQKMGKKGKKDKKDSSSSSSSGAKRARAQTAKEAAARAGKLKRKAAVDAAKILAKLGPIGLKLRDVLDRPRISEVPKGIVQRAQKALSEVTALETQAKQQTLQPSAESGLSLDEATRIAKTATEVHGCCLKLLTAVEAL